MAGFHRPGAVVLPILQPHATKEEPHLSGPSRSAKRRFSGAELTKWTVIVVLLLRCLNRLGQAIAFPWNRAPTASRSCTSRAKITAQTVILQVDHFNNTDSRTFKNRYWMNSTHYEKGGPVFFFDGGESGLSDRQAAGPLSGENLVFAPLELARRFKGIAITWEHRFFGESMPFEYDEESGLALDGYEAYKYLTNEQALEDAVYFARNLQLEGLGDLSSNSTPWIWMGGSYPGARAAIVRQRNPDVFYASWSSSGPVQNQPEMPVYYNTLLQTMPANCSADVHAAVTYADNILVVGTGEEIELLRRAVFLASDANLQDHRQFRSAEEMSLWDIASILSYTFQESIPDFQSFGYNRALGEFCNQIEQWNPANFSGFTMTSPSSALSTNSDDANFTAGGIAATYGAEKAFYAYLFAQITKSIRDLKEFPGRRRAKLDDASWKWQLCSQNGQFHVSSYPNPTNIVSRFYNFTNHAKHFCHDMFPYAPDKPDVDSYLKYGGWDMKPSNVMWTNGELDPWRALGVHATVDINPDAPARPRTTEVPRCKEAPAGDAMFGLVYPGEVHCSDLMKPNDVNVTRPVDLGLELFSDALDAWLKCFPSR